VSSVVTPLLALVALGACLVLLRMAAGAWRRYRGTRLVRCPENLETAAVALDTPHVLLTAVTGASELRLQSCSRWPERRDCGQACLRQIEAAPHDCLVRTILTRWYAGKSCVLCGRPFDAIDAFGHMTALVGPDGTTSEWGDVPAERLPVLLTTHRPACWNCHVAESFRRLYPELVTDRSKAKAGAAASRHDR
jgi:hypothetical protein